VSNLFFGLRFSYPEPLFLAAARKKQASPVEDDDDDMYL
jgi:hypothetical protein